MEFGGSRKLQEVVGHRGGTVRTEFGDTHSFLPFLNIFEVLWG